MIYDGGSRRSAASLGGVGRQIIRDWVLRFNAHRPDGLIDRKVPGAVPKLNAAWRQSLAEKVVCGPTPAVDGVVRWRLKDLAQGDGVPQAVGPAPSPCPGCQST